MSLDSFRSSSRRQDINTSVLEALVPKHEKDDLSNYIDLDHNQSGELVSALKEMQANERKLKVQQAAAEIQKLVSMSNELISNTVTDVRAMRAQIKQMLARLERINRARAYGYETMNFLPLVSAVQGNNDHEVPENWKAGPTDK